jgi:RNA polymerase sigma factor (sigma-70 family)
MLWMVCERRRRSRQVESVGGNAPGDELVPTNADALRLGDPRVWRQLYAGCARDIHGFLARRGGRDAADELLGEVWVRAYQGRERLDADARPWLFGIARHVLHEHWRRHGPTQQDDGVSLDQSDEVVERLDALALRPHLTTAIERLPVAEREVLLLNVWEQLTPGEVAKVLSIPAGTARSRLHRARETLRMALEIRTSAPLVVEEDQL